MKVIKYKKVNRFNIGTEENPKWHEYELEKKIPWSEDNEEFAKAEAHNGEYVIEDDGQPEPDTATTDDVLNALLGVRV